MELREQLISEYYDSLSRYTTVPSREQFGKRLKLFVLFRILQVLGAYGFRGCFEKKQYFIDSIPGAVANLRQLLNSNRFPYPCLTEVLTELVEKAEYNAVPAGKQCGTGIPLSQPPYGYIKNPDDPRFWVIDPEAADVVRRIYDMALEGYGLAEIANALGADGIVNPTYYWRSKGVNRSGSKSTLEPTKWGHTTIKKILTLQEYCGDVIVGLSMMCYTMGKEKRTALGDFQLSGRMGKLLYCLCRTASCLAKSSKE